MGIRPPFYASGGQKPPPTFAASRKRRDLIIANPRRVFPKREGRSPPSLVAQGWGIFKGEGRSKLPSPLNGVLWILSFAKERKYPAGGIPRRGAELPCLSGKKVTRRRQKRKKKPSDGAEPRPYNRLPILHFVLDLSFRGREAPVGIRPPFYASGGQKPPPTFAASRKRRDLIIANPRRVFPKREGRSPPSLVAQGWGIFKGEGRSKLPSPLNGVLWILSFAKERKYPTGGIPRRGAELPCLSGKKVTRRRQKRKKKKEKKAARRRPSCPLSIYYSSVSISP